MAPNPLKPLITGMFFMLALTAAVLFAHFLRVTMIEQEERREAARQSMAIETKRRFQEREKTAQEMAQPSAKVAEARAKERAQLEEIQAKKPAIDVGAAFGKLRRKAEAGDAEAQALMGYIHLRGMDAVLRVDPKTFGVSSSTKHATALIGQDIGPLFFNTRFTAIPRMPQDRATGMMWYDRAARQGHLDAQASLASAYAYGPTPVSKFVDGYQWCLIADQKPWPTDYPSLDGNTTLSRQRCRDMFERKLTDEEKALARKGAEAFRPTKE